MKYVPPLLSLRRRAYKEAVHLVAASDQEVYGFLLGHYTRAGAQAHEIVVAPQATCRDDAVYYEDADMARYEGSVLEAHNHALELVGRWHSHPHKTLCVQVLLPQLDHTDESTTADGAFELIFTSSPDPGWRPDAGTFSLIRVLGKMLVRCEAWLRRGKEFLPARFRLF